MPAMYSTVHRCSHCGTVSITSGFMSAAPKCDSEPMQWFNPVPASLARVQARRYHFCGGSAGATSAADCRRDRIRNIANRKYIRNIRFLLISNERITIVVQFQLLAEQLRVWFNPDSNHYTLHRHLKWFQCIFSEYFDRFNFFAAKNSGNHRLRKDRYAMLSLQLLSEGWPRPQVFTAMHKRYSWTNIRQQ